VAVSQQKSLWQRLPELLDRVEILQILEQQNEAACRELAGRDDAPPEALFYLATDGSPEMRRAVAANPSTPAQANRHLADDADDEVRVELARKIGQLLPNLPQDASKRLRELTIETLERLARDALPRVRQVLAEEIKSLDCVPRRVIKALARDVEVVAAPILEYSPLLSDADLVDVITSAQASFALLAIAKRRPLGSNVSEAIATALDVPAVAVLLQNSGAQIRNQTLDKIVRHAERIRDWHIPLVLRNDLSQRAIRRLASFVSKALIEQLAAKHKLDENTSRYLKDQMKKRIETEDVVSEPSPARPPDFAALHKKGKLDDAFVERAVEDGARQSVVASLALLSGISAETAGRILDSGSAKPIVSLVWRAGLSVRVAFKIQTSLLRLPAGELLPARDGVRFPLTEDQMRWHLNYFGVTV
jgi:uncharacterized protein (DUF2336 family)